MKKLITILGLGLVLAGCGGGLRGKSNLTPPAPLDPAIVATTKIDWVAKTGATTEKEANLRFLIAEDHQGNFYIAGSRGTVAAISGATGAKLWERKTDNLYSGIAYQDGVLLVGREDAHLEVLSATNGETLWERKLLGAPGTAPVSDGRLAIIRTLAGAIETFDLHSGEPGWAYMMNSPEMMLRSGAAPAVMGDKLVVPSDFGRIEFLDLATGASLWGVTLSKPANASFSGRLRDIDAPLIISGDRIYVGELSAGVSAITHRGQKVWQAGEGVYSGIAYDGETIYAVEEDSTIRALSAHNGAEEWFNTQLTGRFLTKPVVIHGRIIVGDYQGYVHVVDATSGLLVSSTQVAKSEFLPDIKAVGENVLLQDHAGNLYKVSI